MDRYPGEIWIGGKVTRPVLKGLIDALSQDGASHAYGDKAIDIDPNSDDAWDELATYLDDESLLNLKDNEAHNGEFEITEQFCKENDIAFDRNSDGYCEYEAENLYFRPPLGKHGKVLLCTRADRSGLEIVDLKIVREGLALVEKFKDNYDTSDRVEDWENLAAGIRLLKDVCPDLPPNLKKFEII